MYMICQENVFNILTICVHMYIITPRGISPGQYCKNIIMDSIPVSRGQMSRVRCHDDIGFSSSESLRLLVLESLQILGRADGPVLRTINRSSIGAENALFNWIVGVRPCRFVFDSDRLLLLSLGTRWSSLTAFNFDVDSPSLESMIRQGP